MAKKLKKQSKKTVSSSPSSLPINKNKSLSTNLNNYISKLRQSSSHLPTKQYLNLIHKYIAKYAQKKGAIQQSMVISTINKIKICKKCDRWAMGSKKGMLKCQICQDNYHYQCIEDNQKQHIQEKEWRCHQCQLIPESDRKSRKQLKSVCYKCKNQQNKNQVNVKCLKCTHLFHKKCYGEPNVVCQDCDKEIIQKIDKIKAKQMKQLTLGQSFRKSEIYIEKKKQKQRQSKRVSDNTNRSTITVDMKNKVQVMHENEQLNTVNTRSKKQSPNIFKSQQFLQNKTIAFNTNLFKKQQNKQQKQPKQQQKQQKQHFINQSTNSSTIISSSKNFRNKLPFLTSAQIQYYKQKLTYAILSKNFEYSESLICQNGCSLYDDNQDSLDFALTHLSMSDMKMFKQYKAQPIGPFLLEYKQKCGYDVVADMDLPKNMIVCEYVGDVYTVRDFVNLNQYNDSVMELKKGKNSDESLVILPRKYTNIARFINGINTNDPQSKEKQNVNTIRSLANGRPVVILYTIKAVKKGQSLLYDYGAGLAPSSYDTSNYQ